MTSARFSFNSSQIAVQIIFKPILNQTDWHTQTTLNGEFIQQGRTIGQIADLPGPLKAAEIIQH